MCHSHCFFDHLDTCRSIGTKVKLAIMGSGCLTRSGRFNEEI